MDNIIFKSPIGYISISKNDDCITALHFFDNEQETTFTDDILLLEAKNQLLSFFEGKLKIFDLPIYIHGSNFENKVWELLQNIPFGKTINYSELAQQVGNITFTRAVGTANGRNPIPIIIPCHRVIGKDGSLTGFSGGLWRKKWLLDHENKWENGVNTLF